MRCLTRLRLLSGPAAVPCLPLLSLKPPGRPAPALPLPCPCLAPGALKTFYLYHVLATGETDSTTMSLGPFNYARMPTSLRPVNPGLIVSSVRDQGKQVGLCLLDVLWCVAANHDSSSEAGTSRRAAAWLELKLPSLAALLAYPQVKFEVAVTLKNVAGRALTSADWQGWEWQVSTSL